MRDRFAPLFPHVFVVTRDPSASTTWGCRWSTTPSPEGGSAVGVYTAVLASPTERVICLACDMPFVTPRLLWELADKSAGFDVFVPRHGEYMQPLCAVYSKRTLDAYLEFIRSGGRRIFDIYPDLNTGYLEMDDGRYGDPEQLFMNVNTPAELEAARQSAAEAGEEGWRAALQPRIQAFMDAQPAAGGVVHRQEEVGQDHGGPRSHQGAAQPGLPGGRASSTTPTASRSTCPAPTPTASAKPGPRWWASPRRTSTCGSAAVEEERPLGELVRQISEPVDLVITEGFKRQDAPKIEVSRRARSTELVSTPDELIGITSDQTFPDYPVPQFALDDFNGLGRPHRKAYTRHEYNARRAGDREEVHEIVNPPAGQSRRLSSSVGHRPVQLPLCLLHAPGGRALQAARGHPLLRGHGLLRARRPREVGISKVRVTGGEPLVRRGLPDLVGLIRAAPRHQRHLSHHQRGAAAALRRSSSRPRASTG